jgi:hypothetical protein
MIVVGNLLAVPGDEYGEITFQSDGDAPVEIVNLLGMCGNEAA